MEKQTTSIQEFVALRLQKAQEAEAAFFKMKRDMNRAHKSSIGLAKKDSLLFQMQNQFDRKEDHSPILQKPAVNFPLLEPSRRKNNLSSNNRRSLEESSSHTGSDSLPLLRASFELSNLPQSIKQRKMSSDFHENKPSNILPTVRTEPNALNHQLKNTLKEKDRFRSLLLRQIPTQNNNVNDNILTGTSFNSPNTRFHSQKERPQELQYLSSRKQIQNQQQVKSSDPEQTLTLHRFNESNDRRFKFACKTKVGFSYVKKGKVNQDSPIIYPKQLAELQISYFAVCDGHGVNGHFVSQLIRKNFPKHMTNLINESKRNQRKGIEDKMKIGDNQSELIGVPEMRGCIQQGIHNVNQDILKSEFDTNLSGSTFVGVFILGNTLLCSNVGDSRAVLARGQTTGEMQTLDLSIDHKPSLERERQRIIKNGGRVEAQRDSQGNQLGPLRVWMSTIDIPGLAMTRSMGDKVGVQAGVNADPEITEREISDDDKFIIVASDGVWEHLSSEDAVRIVQPYFEKGQVEQAAEKLVNESCNAWKRVILNY